MTPIKCVATNDTHVGLVVSKEMLIQLYACWWGKIASEVPIAVEKHYTPKATPAGAAFLPVQATDEHVLGLASAMAAAGLF